VSAEVAKYRAAFFILAESHGHQATTFAEAAAAAQSAVQKQPLVQKADFHAKARNLLMKAADATDAALKVVPPLPYHITGQARTNQQVAQGGSEEMLGQPDFGWRPKVFTDLTGNFFPADVKKAAAPLSGGLGGIGSLGLVGAASLGTVDVTQGNVTGGDSWWTSLQRAFGYGLDAAGKAAASEGNKVADSNPSTAGALQTGGGILSTLSHLLTGGVQQGMMMPVQSSVDWGVIAVVGGIAAVGSWLIWKHSH
jgi:hypothetical protein